MLPHFAEETPRTPRRGTSRAQGHAAGTVAKLGPVGHEHHQAQVAPVGGVGASETGWGHRAGHSERARTDQGGTGPYPSVTEAHRSPLLPQRRVSCHLHVGVGSGVLRKGEVRKSSGLPAWLLGPPRGQSAAGGVSGPTGHLPALPGHAQRVKPALTGEGKGEAPAVSLQGTATPSGPATPGLAVHGRAQSWDRPPQAPSRSP